MTWALAEAICDSVRDYVQDNGTAKLTEVAARYDDDMDLADFAAIVYHDPEAAAEADYPVLYVIPTEASVIVGPGGFKRGFMVHQGFEFAVIVEKTPEDGDSETTLRRRAMRYMVALLEMLAESVDTTGVEWAMGEGTPTVHYLPIYSVNERAFADVRFVTETVRVEGVL